MATSEPLIAYLRDCLQAERSRAGVPNLFAAKILNRRFLSGEETATAHQFASLDLAPSITKELIRRARLRGHTSELLYATLPISCRLADRAICAPLLLYPLAIEEDSLRVLHEEVRVNPALGSLFELPNSLHTNLLDLIPGGEIGPVSPNLLGQALCEFIPNLDLEPLEKFPALSNVRVVREATGRRRPSIFSASAVILTDRSSNVSGLLNELEKLSDIDAEDHSPPLRVFFGEPFHDTIDEGKKGRPELLPALLSSAQADLLDSINSFPLSVCEGPPGTGKSFSLAVSAAEQILRGQSVLIACRSEEAAGVLQRKLEELVPDSRLIVRAGRREHLRSIKNRVDELLASHGSKNSPPHHRATLDEIVSELHKTSETIREEVRDALNTGELFRSNPDSWWKHLRKWFHLRKLSGKPLLAEAMESFHQLHQKRLTVARAYNRQVHQHNLHQALNHPGTIETLKAYRKALRRRHVADQEKALLQLNPAALFRIFPIWITTTDDLHRILPCQANLFDLAILDEATQCDLASALPVFYRAKRALISGDRKQLRHLSFLARNELKNLANKHNLNEDVAEDFDFRRVSLIDRAVDLTLGTRAFTMLDEHFRSRPGLIAFSNEIFYGKKLRLMREAEVLKQSGSTEQPLQIRAVNGARDANGVNLDEIQTALKIIKSASPHATLGFLSPFRAQVDAFLDELGKTLREDEFQHLLGPQKLLAGTSHSFQGEERDHLVLSLVLDDDSPPGARRFAEREDVFNVAVTRARNHMDVLTSFDPSKLPADSLLRRYLVHQKANPAPETARIPSLKDLLPTLSALGWKQLPNESLAGVRLDLLVKRGDEMMAIDLIGTEGEEGAAICLTKSLILERFGIPLYPLRLDEWLHRRHRVIEFFNNREEKIPESSKEHI